jgi:cytochrome c oxidase subunit 4
VSDTRTQETVEEGLGHIVPLPILGAVWVALLVFTWLTVAAWHLDLGQWNLWLALGIALVKAGLVVLYFMHLRYDRPLYAVIFITALVFVVLFIGLALVDALQYQSELIPGR